MNENIDTFQKYLDRNYFESQSLAKVWDHIQPEKGLILATSWRYDVSEEENWKNWNELKSYLSHRKIGFWIVDGAWKELDENNNVKLDEAGKEIAGDEPTFAIPFSVTQFSKEHNKLLSIKEFEKLSIYISKKYEQNAILIKAPNTDMYILDKNQKHIPVGSDFHPDKIAAEFTRLKKGSHKNRVFVFESVEVPGDFGTAIYFSSIGQLR